MSFRKLFFFTLIFSCSIVSTSASASDQLLLNGTAIHTSLQQDYYYAALFSESRSDDPQTLLWQENQRMEITILVDEWSKRRFTQHLGQAIAINNTADDQEHHAKDIATFNTLIKDYLIRGDRIVINKDIDKGTAISINGITLMETKSHDFFGLFLNTWLGARPPSSIFKASILGQQSTVDSSMMTSYESLMASNTRINDLKEWNKKEQPKIKVVTKKAAEPIQKKVIATKAIAKKSAPIIIETQPRYVDTTELIESADMATTIAADHTPLDFNENTVKATSLKKAIDPNSLLLASNTKDNDLANNALAELNKQKKQLLRFYRSTILTSTYKKIVYPYQQLIKTNKARLF